MIPALVIAAARRRGAYLPPLENPYLPGDDTLVTIPTYDGSGETAHPSVVDMGGLWNGYRWWFADTPYPNDNDQLENPSIFASNNRAAWEVPAGVTNPLAFPPPRGFNSDTELVWDPDARRMVICWREYVSSRTPTMIYRFRSSTDGATWHSEGSLVVPTGSWYSPTIWRVGPGDWRMWTFGDTSPPHMWTAPTAVGPWTFAAACVMPNPPRNWHGDIIKHEGRWIGIFSNKSSAYPMASTDDGVTWLVGQALGIVSYRPTFCPSTEGGEFDIWSSRQSRLVYYHRRPQSLWDL